MNSWQIWREVILRVAASTAETLEAKVIKLFFYEVGFIFDPALDKVRLVCSSEYALRSFAPYSWRCFNEAKSLLDIPSLGYSLEVVSAKELAQLHESGQLPRPEFLAAISLEGMQAGPSAFPKVDCLITAGPAEGLNPINAGFGTFPQGMSGMAASAHAPQGAAAHAPAYGAAVYGTAASAAYAAGPQGSTKVSGVGAFGHTPNYSAPEFNAAAAPAVGANPIQMQSAAADLIAQDFSSRGGEAVTDVVKTGDLASLRLPANSSYEEHDTNHRELHTSSWVTDSQPSNCASGNDLFEPAQDGAVSSQTYDRQCLNNTEFAANSDLAALIAEAEAAQPDLREVYPDVSQLAHPAPNPLYDPAAREFCLIADDWVQAHLAPQMEHQQVPPVANDEAFLPSSPERLSAPVMAPLASDNETGPDLRLEDSLGVDLPANSLTVAPEDGPYIGAAAKSTQNTEAMAAAIHNMPLMPRPELTSYDDSYDYERTPSYSERRRVPLPARAELAPSAGPEAAPHFVEPEVELVAAPAQNLVAPAQPVAGAAPVAHAIPATPAATPAPVAVPATASAQITAPALEQEVPPSVRAITRCEELADEILKPVHASDLVTEALNAKAQREQAARNASIAALPQVVTGPMASVYAAAAKRKRNCSSLPQPNALLNQEKVQTTTLNPDEPAVLPAPDLLRQVEGSESLMAQALLPDDGSRHQLNLDNFKLTPEQIESSKNLNQVLAEQFKIVSAQRAAYKARQAELAKNRALSHKRKGEPELLERFDGTAPGLLAGAIPGVEPVMSFAAPCIDPRGPLPGSYPGSQLGPMAGVTPEQPELTLAVPTVEINPVKTFSTYVSDTRNFEILNAASLLAKYVGVSQVNPFLVYGDSGVGKTHILHAIANAIAYYHPDYKVAFIRAEEFLQNYVSSISESGKNRFADSQIYFQQAFLQYDVLIFDDIQALAKGVKSRQVFFEVISAFLDRPGTQLIVAANTMPRELKEKGFDASLLSRMGSGLCMPLMKPNWSNRRDIVNAKCQEMGITMSEDIVDYISINMNPNVREIEGALKTLHSFLNSNGSLSYDDAVRTLSGFISSGSGHVLTISEIQSTVAKEFGVSVKDLLSSCKKKAISQARSLAMTIARDVIANNSLNDLGRAFKKDHTSVHEAIVRTRDRLQHDSSLKEKYDHIIKALAELTRKP